MRPRSFWVCDKEFCVLSLLKNRTGVLWVLNIVAQQLMNISHPWCLEKIVRTLLSFIQVSFLCNFCFELHLSNQPTRH